MTIKKIGIIVADIDEYKPFKENINSKFKVNEIKLFGKSAIEFVINGVEAVCVCAAV